MDGKGLFDYAGMEMPSWYLCAGGCTDGVRLHMEEGGNPLAGDVWCDACVADRKDRMVDKLGSALEAVPKQGLRNYQFVPAVPTPDGKGVFASTCISEAGRKWWENRPKAEVLARETREKYLKFDTARPGQCLGVVVSPF